MVLEKSETPKSVIAVQLQCLARNRLLRRLRLVGQRALVVVLRMGVGLAGALAAALSQRKKKVSGSGKSTMIYMVLVIQ